MVIFHRFSSTFTGAARRWLQLDPRGAARTLEQQPAAQVHPADPRLEGCTSGRIHRKLRQMEDFLGKSQYKWSLSWENQYIIYMERVDRENHLHITQGPSCSKPFTNGYIIYIGASIPLHLPVNNYQWLSTCSEITPSKTWYHFLQIFGFDLTPTRVLVISWVPLFANDALKKMMWIEDKDR